MRWVTQQPGITSAIIVASRPEQLDANLRAADMDKLTEQELAFMDGAMLVMIVKNPINPAI
ncbi:hypothetical protein Back11_08690 [Paenibacillus baekrokdamisoli]|uniref:NADP-dependent oxidoreductase domain-containing protein n=1 Tax=Paenibacillus baekrokdamisoli TaxID=1712516 RepID=A0A3G9J8C4_9BACL|nr:aryl-alcohol dehydrogenase-like predicted oxidoreductase [Paenibacillus baekrokdamisoli]BBH19524.1 hypothetical protein Back11_08690 [Paenibacillus baekrokdamisoli]